MTRPLILVLLFAVPTSLSSGSVLRKTIHADGRKDFIIAKDIKQNQCTCSCSCIPHTDEEFSTTTQKPSSTMSFVEEVTKNAETWLTDEFDKQHPESQTTSAVESITSVSREVSAGKTESGSESMSTTEAVRIPSAASTEKSTLMFVISSSVPSVEIEHAVTSRVSASSESSRMTEPRSAATVELSTAAEEVLGTSESSKRLSDEPLSVAGSPESTKASFGTFAERGVTTSVDRIGVTASTTGGTATETAGKPFVQDFGEVEGLRSSTRKAELPTVSTTSVISAVNTTLSEEVKVESSEQSSTSATVAEPARTDSSDLRAGLKSNVTIIEKAKTSVSEATATVPYSISGTTRRYEEEGVPIIHAEKEISPVTLQTRLESSSVTGLGLNRSQGAEVTEKEISTTMHSFKVFSEAATSEIAINVGQGSTVITGNALTEGTAEGSFRTSGQTTTLKIPSTPTTVASIALSETTAAHIPTVSTESETKSTTHFITANHAITLHTPESTIPTVTALEQQIMDATAESEVRRSSPTATEFGQTDGGQVLLTESQSSPSVLAVSTTTIISSATPEVNTSERSINEAAGQPIIAESVVEGTTIVLATASHAPSTEQHELHASTKALPADSGEVRLLPTDGDLTRFTPPKEQITIAVTPSDIHKVSGTLTTTIIIEEAAKVHHEKTDEAVKEQETTEDKTHEGRKEATRSTQPSLTSILQGMASKSAQESTVSSEIVSSTQESSHTMTMQESAVVRVVPDKPVMSRNVTEMESLNETHNLIAASEIVPKTVRFEEKRFDIVNKTDSSDIYVHTRILTSTSASVALSTFDLTHEATGITASKSEQKTEETDLQLNKTHEEIANVSKIESEKSLLSDLGGNIIEASNKTFHDEKVVKLQEKTEPKPVKTAAQVDPLLTSPDDRKYDVYVQLEKPLITVTDASKLLNGRTTAKESYGGGLQERLASQTSEILIPLHQLTSITTSKIESSTATPVRSQEIGGGESFKMEETGHGIYMGTYNDPNEHIRLGWRKALEELRQKLRAYQESLKARKDEKNGAKGATDRKDIEHRKKETVDLIQNNGDDKEGHLYIIQLGIKDLEKPPTESLSLDSNNHTESNINSTNLFRTWSGDSAVEKSGRAENLLETVLLNSGTSSAETRREGGSLKQSVSSQKDEIKAVTESSKSEFGEHTETSSGNSHWKPLKSEIHHDRQQVMYLYPEGANTLSTPTIVSPGTTNKEVVGSEKLIHEKVGVDFSIDEHPDAAGKEIPVDGVQIPAQDVRIPAQQHKEAERFFGEQKFSRFPQTLQIHLSEANGTVESDGTVINPPELRRKMQEERNRAMLGEGENKKFVEEENRKRKVMLDKETEGKDEEGSAAISTRLLEEKARLEQARLLREEQTKLEKQQELQRGLANKSQLERQEEIARQLEQLAESERRHREQLEREKLVQLARTKHYRIVPTGDSFSATRTDITTLSESNVQSSNGRLLPVEQCSTIQKFARLFQMADPADWVRMHCPFAKLHFPKASCEHIQQLFESCFQ